MKEKRILIVKAVMVIAIILMSVFIGISVGDLIYDEFYSNENSTNTTNLTITIQELIVNITDTFDCSVEYQTNIIKGFTAGTYTIETYRDSYKKYGGLYIVWSFAKITNDTIKSYNYHESRLNESITLTINKELSFAYFIFPYLNVCIQPIDWSITIYRI